MPMRVAVVGLGWWGKQIISCLKSSPRFAVLQGIDPAASEDVKTFLSNHGVRYLSDLDAALSSADIDGVILATPHQMHETQCLQVLAAGKELFCEKPLTMTVDGAKRVLDACAKANKVLGVGHERRYEECFELVGRLIAAGALGKPLMFDANISHDLFRNIDRSNWRLDPRHAPAGMMTATASTGPTSAAPISGRRSRSAPKPPISFSSLPRRISSQQPSSSPPACVESSPCCPAFRTMAGSPCSGTRVGSRW
jgi:predicted dehydrogenase